MDVDQPLYVPDYMEREIKLMGVCRIRLFAAAWKIVLAAQDGTLPKMMPATMLVPLHWSPKSGVGGLPIPAQTAGPEPADHPGRG